MAETHSLIALSQLGQSIWIDYFRRNLITSGELQRLRDEDRVTGITSNPTIFEKAIVGSTDYDAQIRDFILQDPHRDARALYAELVTEDLRQAADVLRPVYDRTDGTDGFVSLEVSPDVAHDTSATLEEARRLWKALSRPNVMIKIPATPEGLPAIDQLTAEGINVNITLMFSLSQYEEVARAYIRGIEKCADPRQVSSVASFFVSRVDTKVDRLLDQMGSEEALALKGRMAIANSRLVYRRFREMFGAGFDGLRKRGARVQKPLWASTRTKNPAYRDVVYVEELIGPDTINTMPPATLHAFRDHGQVRGATAMEGDPQLELSLLRKTGIDLDRITEELLNEGIKSFADSFENLIHSLDEKRRAIFSEQSDRQRRSLGSYAGKVEQRLEHWKEGNFVCRMWRKDPTLWSSDPSTAELRDRLGWLYLPESMQDQIREVRAFAEEIKAEGYHKVVLLGMGGSSLAPAVLQAAFGNTQGYPELEVLDSTHPAAIHALRRKIDPLKTLFLVSSKSGTTLETLTLFSYFWSQVRQMSPDPGRNFVAITDPGTPLVQQGKDRGFRRVFLAPPDVGGRYSALSHFGMVPAALIGIDIDRLLDKAWQTAEACRSCVDPSRSPGALLGAAMGELAVSGRDKLTFITEGPLSSLPLWIEQLVAESTGKNGKGIIPVAGEEPGPPAVYGSDRVFAVLRLAGSRTARSEQVEAIMNAGHPVLENDIPELSGIGQEFFLWEFAVAAAGAILEIHPFDQPDVQYAKDLARKAMESKESRGLAPKDMLGLGAKSELAGSLNRWLDSVRPGDYLAIQAYLAPTPDVSARIEGIRNHLRDRLRIATTTGFGPRFLHSTGQLHKGGPNNGLFIQLTDEITEDVSVPEKTYTFGTLIRAQAEGDYEALKSRGRRIVRINLGDNATAGLEQLALSLHA